MVYNTAEFVILHILLNIVKKAKALSRSWTEQQEGQPRGADDAKQSSLLEKVYPGPSEPPPSHWLSASVSVLSGKGHPCLQA